MEHYDLRVIEDCLVFSYEVECPNYPKENALEQKKHTSSHDARRKEKRFADMKKTLLRMVLCAMMPLAFLLDLMFEGLCLAGRFLRSCVRGGMKYVPALGTISCFFICTAILYIL